MSYTYRKGVTTGRPMTLLWHDFNGVPIDFSTGYTFAVYIVDRNTPAALLATKTTGITGYANAALGYNILIDWAPADFTSLPAGRLYTLTLVATTAGGDPFAFPGNAAFKLEAAPA